MITFILAVCGNVDYVYSFPLSPPSRAAWIEIVCGGIQKTVCYSRRLHGRRGLKSLLCILLIVTAWSPPSRAAGIESRVEPDYTYVAYVAAFTGGVD